MKVKLILPALTEATSPFWRPIKYSLFPPLGLATLAGYLDRKRRDHPARRARRDARPGRPAGPGGHPGLHHLRLPRLSPGGPLPEPGRLRVPGRAARHRPARRGRRPRRYHLPRSGRGHLAGLPARLPGRLPAETVQLVRAHIARPAQIRRDLIKRQLYLVPNSLVVSRGCPHDCDFCYKESFYAGGKSFYTQHGRRGAGRDRQPARSPPVLPGRPPVRQPALRRRVIRRHARHGPRLAGGRNGRSGPAAGSAGKSRRLPVCAACSSASRRSIPKTCASSAKGRTWTGTTPPPSAACTTYGVMVNASFVFGMDEDDETVFERTVDWAVEQGIETATFHILTPYPGTALYDRMQAQGRITSDNWDLYDTRHVVFQPARMIARGAGGRLLAGLPRLLPLVGHLSGRLEQARPARAPAPPGLRRRLEEIRAALGSGHPAEAGFEFLAALGNACWQENRTTNQNLVAQKDLFNSQFSGVTGFVVK